VKRLRLLARLITPWRTIRRLERELDRLESILTNPLVSGIEIGRERGIEMGMHGSGPQLMAGMFLGLLQDNRKHAPNYLELTFHSPEGPILVTVTQPNGATPSQLQRKAESEVRRLQGELLRLQAAEIQRGNGDAAPAAPLPSIIPKPQPPGGRLIGPGGVPIGYQPRPSRPGASPPPSEP
jgi:hypothetical protein